MSNQNQSAFIVFFIILITVNCLTSDKPNLIATGQSDGTVTVSWNNVNQKNAKYILSYTYNDASNTPITRNATIADNSVQISGAFLGVNYQFRLFCSPDGITVAEQTPCADLQFLALPSCPIGWHQQLTQCYYMSNSRKTWAESRDTCLKYSTDLVITESISEADINEELKADGQVLFWTAIDACTKLSQEDVSRHNCCMSLNANGNLSSMNPFSMTSDFQACSSERQLRFLCTTDVKAKTINPENINVHSMTNDSVSITWTEPNDGQLGWNFTSRTVSVYDRNRRLVATAVSANQSALVQSLKTGQTYNVFIWPYKVGHLLNNAVGTKFHLVPPLCNETSNAGVLSLPVQMTAVLDQQGWIRITWQVARRKKYPWIEFDADGYQLIYGLMDASKDDYTRVNLTKRQTMYNLTNVQGNQQYRFYLVCIFGEWTVGCGTIQKFKVELANKVVVIGNQYMSYQGMTGENAKKKWIDAENDCVQRSGHLISVVDKNEDNNISNVLPILTSFWIGANLSTNDTIHWSDGSSWQYKNGLKMDPDSVQHRRCVHATYDSRGISIWTTNFCNLPMSYICKYVSTDLGFLSNLTATLVRSTTVQLKWRTTNKLWPVSTFKYKIFQLNSQNINVNAVTKSPPVIISGLERNTTYQIEIVAQIDLLDIKVSANITIMTGDDLEVQFVMSADGKTTISWSPWSSKSLNATIIYEIQPINETVTENTIELNGFEFSNIYNYILKVIDNKTGTILEETSFNITARPSCSKDEFQLEMLCYFVGNQSVTWDQGRNSCNDGKIAYAESNNEVNFLTSLSQLMDSEFWIDGQTSSPIDYIFGDGIEEFNMSLRVRREIHPESGCRIISNRELNKSIAVVSCTNKFPVMCQKKLTLDVGSVSEVFLQNVSSSEMTLRWSSSSTRWKPTTYQVIVTAIKHHDSRKKRNTIKGDVILGDNSATIANLQPSTDYQVDITPVVNTFKGKTTSVHVSTIDSNSTASPYPLPLIGAADTSNLGTSENMTTSNETGVEDLRIFRLISSLVLICLAFIAFMVFTICRMYRYRDCMSQMCFQVSLIIAHILILLDVDTKQQVDCKAVSIGIHFFFTSAFTFFALECLCHAKAMTRIIPMGMLNKTWQYFTFGWGIPIVVIIASTATVSDEYVHKSQLHCWLNIDGRALLVTVIPIGIFALLALLFLCLAICGRPDENYEVDEESYIRYDPLQDIRWMLLFMLGLLVSHWAVGMLASHEVDGNMFLAFIVLTIVLAISIFILRCIGDNEIRYRVKACCQGSAIGPGDEDMEQYMSKTYSKKKGMTSQQVPNGDGMLIVRKTYIFRP